MPTYQPSDPRLAAILSGDAPWPTEQEQTMAEKQPDVLSTGMPVSSNAPTDGSTQTLDDGRVLQGRADAPTAAAVGTYTPSEDVTDTDALGVVTLVAAKGVPIPLADAQRLGLVKAPVARGPQETK